MPRSLDQLPGIQLTSRQVRELELLAIGALAPRTAEFTVLRDEPMEAGSELLLRDPFNFRLAVLRATACDASSEGYSVTGDLQILELPGHADFRELRRRPSEVRDALGNGAALGVMLRALPDVALEQKLQAWNGPVLLAVAAGDDDYFPVVRAARLIADPATLVTLVPAADPSLDEVILRNFGASEILAHHAPGALSQEIAELVKIPPRHEQGFCVWFTGLPSAGKSTVAEALAVRLRERGRLYTLLDGDVVRTHLSKGLGFSREDRDTNIRRIGFVASEIVRHHGAVICAAVSPYRATRRQVRDLVGADRFIEVYVSTPQETCEARDVKGFYAKARAGHMQGMTGVDDPYEPPLDPEITLATTGVTPESNAACVLGHLERSGFLQHE